MMGLTFILQEGPKGHLLLLLFSRSYPVHLLAQRLMATGLPICPAGLTAEGVKKLTHGCRISQRATPILRVVCIALMKDNVSFREVRNVVATKSEVKTEVS
jgi:hypothetical protein